MTDKNLLIITPVKDSIAPAIETITRVCELKRESTYNVYNDRSLPESRTVLEHGSILGYQVINVEDHVGTPSPNQRFILIDAQKRALDTNSHLLVIEPNALVKPNTINRLLELAEKQSNCGLIAAITADENGSVNLPYLHIKKNSSGIIKTRRRISLCCTLLTNEFLKSVDLKNLSTTERWHDRQLSKLSRRKGFQNIIDTDLKVVYLPANSRYLDMLKSEKPLKYFWKRTIN